VLYDESLKRAKLIGEAAAAVPIPAAAGRSIHASASSLPPAGPRIPSPTNWEGTGVTPDVAVAADQALRVALLEITRSGAETGTGNGGGDLAPAASAEIPRRAATRRRRGAAAAAGTSRHAANRTTTMSDGLAKVTSEQLPMLKSALWRQARSGRCAQYVGPAGLCL
jgi:hypothetical protein